MMKHISLCLCLLVGSAFAQTHTEDTLEDPQVITALKTFNGGIIASSVNNVVKADAQLGADACAKINAALALMPSGGGIVDARGLTGAQTCGSAITFSTPSELLFGAISLTGPASGDIINPTVGGYKIIGCGRACTILKAQTSAQAHGIHGSNTGGTSFLIRDLAIKDSTLQTNPSLSTRTAGAGIRMDHNSGGVSSWGVMENVDVYSMFNGYDLDNPITTAITGGWLQQNVQDGIRWVGGTSTNFTGTYAKGNGRYNWFISNVGYSSLNGAASDSAGLNGPTYAISAISSTSNVVTVTTTGNTPIVGHQWVTIAGVTDTTFNGNFETVSSNGTNQFTYSLTGGDRSSSGGTAQVEGIAYFCTSCVNVVFNGSGDEVSTGLGFELLNSNGVQFNGRILNPNDHGMLIEGSRDISLFGYLTGAGINGTGYGLNMISALGAFGSNSSSPLSSLGVTNYGMGLNNGNVNISTIARAANVVSVATATAHGLTNGNMVNIAAVGTSSFNGWFKVASVTDSTHFTYAQNGTVQNDTTGRVERDVQAVSGVYQSFMENSFNGFGGIYTDQTIRASQQALNLNLGGNSTGFIGLNFAQGTGSGGTKGGDGTGVATWSISSAGLGTFNGGIVPTSTANPATAGNVQLAKTDAIDWRNNANGANLPLGINGSDQITFNSQVVNDGTHASTLTIASGTATMTTVAITGVNCGTTVTLTATGAASTDTIAWSYNASPLANPGVLTVNAWPAANSVNFAYCNPTAGSVTPNAATLNWRVVR